MPKRISSIGACKFRGATTDSKIDIDIKKSFVLIYGENGTGKSSIVDAIDIVANQKSSLTSISGTTPKKHLPALGADPTELSASITVDDTTWTATFSGASISVSPEEDIPEVQVLRRDKILSLIVAKPSDRFQQLKQFIDVENVQKSEDKLNKACIELKKTVDSNKSDLAGHVQTLTKAYEENRTDDEVGLTWEEWAKSRSSIEAQSVAENLKQIVKALKEDTISQDLLSRKNDKQKLLDEARSLLEKALDELSKCDVSNVPNGSKLVPVLENSKEYFSDLEELENCPVCKKPNDLETIAGEVERSLMDFEELVKLTNTVNSARANVQALTNTVYGIYTDLARQCRSLFETLQYLSSYIPFSSSFSDEDYPHLSKTETDIEFNLTKELIAEIPNFIEHLNGVVKILEQERSKLEQFSLVKNAYERLLELRTGAQKNTDIQNVLKQTLESVRVRRRTFIQETLDAVADECDRLYCEIHPDESIGQVRFALKDSGSGSMDLEGMFKGYDSIPPQAYFSDSHLDTLGFCFFLALAKHSTKSNAIIVLDDVFTTVDLQHMDRILNLLIKESSKFHQIIMTSHQRRWLSLFKANLVPDKVVGLLTLQEWDINSGIHSHAVGSNIERTRTLLHQLPFERDLVGSSAGRLIEGVLEEMTKYLELEVKRNPLDKYTAYPLLSAVKRKVKKIEVYRVIVSESTSEDDFNKVNTPPLDDVIVTLQKLLNDVRNTTAAHYNWDEADVTDDKVKEFARNAIALAEHFVCPDCKGMATKEKNGYLWCPGSCKKLRVTKPN